MPTRWRPASPSYAEMLKGILAVEEEHAEGLLTILQEQGVPATV